MTNGEWNWSALAQQASANNTAKIENVQSELRETIKHAAMTARIPLSTKTKDSNTKPVVPPLTKSALIPNIEVDQFSSLRIVERTISAQNVASEMTGRRFVALRELDRISSSILTDAKTDWVTIGVLIRKTLPKSTANGSSTFMVWALSDLESTECSVFLFDGGYDTHWREAEGSVVAVLNASLIPASEQNKFALKVTKAQEIVKLGRAIDFGICKGTTSNSEKRCRMAVNTSQSQYCLHHITSRFLSVGKRRQQLNSTFKKSVYVGGHGINNISAGVYGVPPKAKNIEWQPIISKKRQRTDTNYATRLSVPTVVTHSGTVVQQIPTSVSLSGPSQRASRGHKMIASLLAKQPTSNVRPAKVKKVDMIKFMSSGATH